MRLSSVLSSHNNNESIEVESFVDKDKYVENAEDASDGIIVVSSGDFIELDIGTIVLPFFSTTCNDNIQFVSHTKLHCLVVNNKMISIDCVLKCVDSQRCSNCQSLIQAWFLVEADDIFAHTPKVHILKHNFRLPDHIKLPIETKDQFSELLGKAEIAYKERLGAGSIIYLRSAFEKITHIVGDDAGVAIYKPNGKTKPFDQVLTLVDERCSIIPEQYSANRYEIFSQLSEIAHGNSDEKSALDKYYALRRLVMGIIDNVEKNKEKIKNNHEIQQALRAIGIGNGDEANE
ncbi:hypothetical protein [Desulfovibrio litoralis]|uniref:Uncharacterized protein n=1 Tax=Desulfovibrio litoralis DSM 11393 TaxID=1121455 RepID=A0A1M7S0Q8_9BACT|nr:hypothetical protein [Desulfovibrio litoralis]SHN52025.1 hypothetical protein SAMN02745728_00411 [Desulfovibrio litoralis DSM 11393]